MTDSTVTEKKTYNALGDKKTHLFYKHLEENAAAYVGQPVDVILASAQKAMGFMLTEHNITSGCKNVGIAYEGRRLPKATVVRCECANHVMFLARILHRALSYVGPGFKIEPYELERLMKTAGVHSNMQPALALPPADTRPL